MNMTFMAQFLLVLQTINRVLTWVFFVCYSYQFFYIAVSLFRKPRTPKEGVPHKFAVIISARNEEAVIGGLIDSVRNPGRFRMDDAKVGAESRFVTVPLRKQKIGTPQPLRQALAAQRVRHRPLELRPD